VWDTKWGRICNTLEWFPTEGMMPLAFSMELVMAGVKDIIHALHHPSANSPLAPPTDSEVAILHQLTGLLSSRHDNSNDDNKTVVTNNTSASPQSPVSSLRVDDPSPSLRVTLRSLQASPPQRPFRSNRLP
jgi:hypothetical protein